jgi:hypothetical protein
MNKKSLACDVRARRCPRPTPVMDTVAVHGGSDYGTNCGDSEERGSPIACALTRSTPSLDES